MKIAEDRLGIAQKATNIRQLPYHMEPMLEPRWSRGMTIQAMPAVTIFPTIQKLARKPIIGPRRSRDMNSVKYEKTTGIAAPTLKRKLGGQSLFLLES